MAWQKNGTPDTLGSSGDTLTISDLTAKIFNFFMLHALDGGTNLDFDFTFNANTNSVYAQRSSGGGGADGTLTSQASWTNAAVLASDNMIIQYVCSISGEEKLGLLFLVTENTSGAATAPSRIEWVGKFVPSPDADITRIDVDNTQTGSYQISSNLSALGTDDN